MNEHAMLTLLLGCCDPGDHLSPRGYALLTVRVTLETLGESLKAESAGG